MKKGLFAVVLLFLSVSYRAIAQTYEVPQGYTLKTKEDFIKYEGDINNTVDWLQQTKWTDQPEKQTEAKKFLTYWATGSPYVTIEIDQPLLKLCKKNPELLFTYMGQFIKYALLHKTDFNKTKANVFAVKAMIDKYTAEPSHKKEDGMEDLIATDGQGKLEEWVKDELNKTDN